MPGRASAVRALGGMPLAQGFEQRKALALKFEAATSSTDANGLA